MIGSITVSCVGACGAVGGGVGCWGASAVVGGLLGSGQKLRNSSDILSAAAGITGAGTTGGGAASEQVLGFCSVCSVPRACY